MKRIRRMSRNMIPLSFSGNELSTLDEDETDSVPCLSMKKSASEPLLQLDPDITIEFEGDGPLGIVWVNNENDAYVGKIADRTVASEEINLKVGLKLILVGDYNCTHISYSDTMNLIRLKWQKFSHIKLTFSTDSLYTSSGSDSDSEEEIEIYKTSEDKDCHIYSFLLRHGAESFHKDFKELGARQYDDLEYIEYQDLVNMKMDTKSRQSISEELQLQVRKVNVYFSPHLSPEELKKEKSKYNTQGSNFIEIHPQGN